MAQLNQKEADAILAGLRYLAAGLDRGDVAPDDGDIGAILTCAGDHEGLTADEIGDFADRLATTAEIRIVG